MPISGITHEEKLSRCRSYCASISLTMNYLDGDICYCKAKTSLCTPGYTGTYSCSGNQIIKQYRYSDCSTAWINSEYCNNGCENGRCKSTTSTYSGSISYSEKVSRCQNMCKNQGKVMNYLDGDLCYCKSVCPEGYITGAYSCSGNYATRKYQYSSCKTDWIKVQYCKYGCENGGCNNARTPTRRATSAPTASCTAGYTSQYSCSGNYKIRQYRSSDCSTSWHRVEYCSNGCQNGACKSSSSYTAPKSYSSTSSSSSKQTCSGNKKNIPPSTKASDLLPSMSGYNRGTLGDARQWINLLSQYPDFTTKMLKFVSCMEQKGAIGAAGYVKNSDSSYVGAVGIVDKNKLFNAQNIISCTIKTFTGYAIAAPKQPCFDHMTVDTCDGNTYYIAWVASDISVCNDIKSGIESKIASLERQGPYVKEEKEEKSWWCLWGLIC